MNDADRYALMLGALRWITQAVTMANDDEDADPWLVLEDVQARCDDTLNAVAS